MNLVSPAAGLSRVSLLVRYATRLPFIVAVVAGFLALTPSDGLALSVGDRVVVACSNPQGLRVRSTAMLSGAIVGGVYDGATGSVVNGPVSRDGYTWVRVSWDYSASQTGWSADCWLVKELARPTLSSPPNYGTIQGSSVTFSWTASGSPSGYNLRVGTSPGSSNILDQTTISPSYTATGLQSGTYYWQVLSIKLCPSCSGSSGGAFSPYSSYRSFTVSAVPQTFDLVPEDVYFTTQPNGGGTRTDSPSAGQSLYPAFQYRVSGSGGSKTGTLAEMWLGSTSLGTITGTANPSAGTVVRGLSSPVTIPSGSFVLKVELDPVDDFQDTKSSNNVFTRSYNVAPPSSFDFQIKDVYLGDSSGRKVTTPRAGDRLYPAVKYSLSVSKGSFVGRAWRIDYDSNAPVFAPSGTSGSAVDRVAVSPTAVTVSEGCHTLSATLNPDGVFGETNTGNNHMSLPPFVAKKSGQPDPPSGVSATQGTLEDRVQVTWPASSGAAKYRVYASPGSSSFLFETAQQRFDHGAAKVGTVYTYSVSGVTLSGVEGPRSCVSATGWRKGTAPVTMKVEPLTGLFFNLVGVGQSRDLKIKISNIGGGTLTGSISGLPQGFSVVGSSAFSIPAGQPQDFTVRFQPSTKKVYEGNAVVSGGSSTVVVPLKGEGGTPTPTGSIRCWIRDHFNSSRLIAGATVQCGGRTFTAAPDGSYLLNDVLPGTYNVRAWRSADPDRFDTKEQSVSVTQGSEKRIDITVKITPPTALPPPNEIPVVLVRGLEWLPVVTESVEVAYWADMRQTLIDAGYCFNSKHGTPVIWDANVLWDTDAFRWKMRSPKTINGAEGIAINADRLSAFIDNQFGIYADSKGYYPKQINIVAHSMGGLVVRQMLKNRSDIAERTGQVIMIATPNAGSPFADAAVVALFSAQVHSLFTVGSLMKASVWTMLVEALEAVGADYLVPSEAIANLTVTHVEFIWGPQTPWRSGPRLHQIAGDPSTAQCSWFYKGFHLILQMLGDNDGVVPVRSVIGFYFKDSKGPRGYQAFPDAPSDLPRGASRDHSELLEDAAVLNQVRAWLAQSPSRSARDEQVLPLSSVPKHRDVPEPVGVHLAPVCNLTGTVAPNSIEERLIALDSEGSAVISVALEDLSVSFTLVAPSRTVITSDNAADSGSTHSRVLLPNSRFAYESYTVAAEPGIWTARVAATSETTQPVAFTISAELETTMTLECSAPERVRSGQGIALTARLFDADTSTVVVLPGASFVATVQEPGGTTWTAVLADDGLVGDGDPLDGVFGAVLDGLTTPGIYGATCNASGSTEAGFAYSRVSGWIFAVADNYGRLTGGFDQEYMDIDADGSTETLRVGVMLSLDKASTYSVTARLDNASGSESIGTVRYSTGLSTGTEQLDLLFQLADFADPDEVGPFTLRDVTLSEETYDGMVWLDRLSGPFAIPAVGARRPVVVDFQTTASAAWEGQAASIQIALTRKSDQPVSVMLAPVGGTASGAGVDYFLDPVRVDFLPGEVSRTVTVPIVDDALMEGDETVEIVLSAPENALLGSATTHTLTILDDDLPDVAVAVRPWPDPPEKGGVAEFTVTARNKGRADATSVALAVELSPNLAFESAYAVDGTVQGMPPGAVWAVGPLAMGQVTTMTLRARQLDNAYSGTTVTATLAQPDLAPLDNTASWNGTPVEMEIVLLPGGVPLEMVRIPAGSFLMGSPSDSGWSRPNESPQHPVRIGYDYLAGRYEVTQEQWTALSTTSPALAHGTGASLPIHNLSWDDIAGPGGFVERLNAHVAATGQGEPTFRLPSESEWEYMCRANSTTRFWFGDSNCDPLGCTDCLLQDTDWYCSTEFSPPGVKPVHSLTPNPFGLFHVHGNVHEWCADTYRADHGNAPADGSAWLDFGGGSHVIRGGAFDSPPVACRSAFRGDPAEWADTSSFGFRLVRTIPSTRADLAVSLTAAPNPAAPGYPVTFSLTARNLGPMGVEDVILTQTLPAGVTVEDFQCAGGTAAVVGADKVVFEWPWLARDASATASLTLVQADAGTLNTTATVTGQCLDTTRTNNVASASVLVSGPAIAVSPSPLAAVGILGQDAPAGTLNVRNMGAGFMSYTIASDAPWLSVTPASGDSSGEVDPITLHFSTAALPTGEHRANLTITSPEACNSPLVMPVTVTITCNATAGPQEVYFNDFETTIGPEWGRVGPLVDDFSRPDAPAVGNGWKDTSGNSGGNMSISAGETTFRSFGHAGIWRPCGQLADISFSATLKEKSGYGGLARQYRHYLLTRNDGTVGKGYGLALYRSDQDYNNSAVALIQDGVVLEQVASSFQYGPEISVSATVRADGSVVGTVSQPGSIFSFSFAARLVASAGQNFAICLDGPDSRNTGSYLWPRVDNVSVTVASLPPPASVAPVGGRSFLGRFCNDEVRLSLQNLPTHERLVLSFDLHIIHTWDGNGDESGLNGPDYWECGLAGEPPVLKSTFSNFVAAFQSYPCSGTSCANPGMTGASEVGALGYPSPRDATYRLSFPFLHSMPDATFAFKGSNLQGVADESWGLDNVKVTIGPPETQTVMLPGGVPLEMVTVPSGIFRMGANEHDAGWKHQNEEPSRWVTIEDTFQLGRFEVTQRQWLAVMNSWPGPAPSPSNGVGSDYPAYHLSWDDIRSENGFLDRLNQHVESTGQGLGTFRLPSEAEWEYSCRAGTDTRFHFGNSDCAPYSCVGPPCLLDHYAWFQCNNGAPNSTVGTKPVGSKMPNGFGLFDMHGNVSEWCEDWYHSSYAGAPTDGSAWLVPGGTYRVIRSSHFGHGPGSSRSAYRHDFAYYPDPPSHRSNTVGVRLARSAPSFALEPHDVEVHADTGLLNEWDGESFPVRVRVRNGGLAKSSMVRLVWPLCSGLTATSASVSQGVVSIFGDLIAADIGSLEPGETVSSTVDLRADEPGVFTSVAHVSMSECDDNSMNNDAIITVTVKPRADVGVSVGPLATPAVVGATVGIPVAVTNHGPGNASDVVLTATLSAGAIVERVETTTGTATAGPGGAATWHCGALGAGQTTTVTLFVKPDAAALASGRLTVEAQVASTAPVDHVPGNNRASATARVIRDFVDLGEGVLLELVHVPEGSYLPGPDDPDWGTAGGTTVTVEEDYYIGRFEVTQAQWQRLIAENPATGAGTGQNVPVYNVSWSDLTSAGGFIARLNDHVTSTGQGPATFRLPTEAQWELACRAGSEARFSFGDSDCTTDTCGSCSLGEYAWYCGNNGAQGAADFGAKAVGTRLPNALDIFDMHGNVAEWCSDETSTDPVAMRAVRGGDWASQPLYAACSFRDGADANLRSPTFGFRVLRTRPLAPMADLKIAADVSPAVTRPDYPTTFTLTVSNAGPDVANDVVVTSTLTSNLTVASAESTSGTLVETGGVLICDLGRMEVGTTETITIVALADPVAPGTTANAAITAVAGADEHDPDPASNTAGAAAVVRDDIVILPGEIPLELVPVSAGTFVMGAGLDPGWSGPTEGPEHEVTLGYGFHLGKHEVTQAQWRALMATSPASGYGEGPNHPVYSVSWNEIAGPDGFIARLNRHIAATRQGPGSFRLPSEAEWEYGCRASAGPATRFSFGDSNCGPNLCGGCDLDDHAWYCGNNGFPGAPDFGAKPVGGRTPNALGAHDMHGNVAEWCADWWHADYNGAPVDGRVWADPQGSNRVVRGGNWAARPAQVASAYRGDSAPPDSRSVTVGFRVARGEPTTTTLSDLQITLEADPEPVLAGDALLYFLTVTNHGPDMANDIVLTQTLPLNAVFLADHSTTGLMGEDGMVTASLGALGAGAAAEMVVAVQPTDEGLLLSGAEVSVSETDHNPSNNSDVVATRVIAVGDLAVESVASSGTVVQGGAAVWSDVVTNHGPSTARGALLWHALADGMEFDASRSTPGMTEVSGGLVALELGDLASGASTTVTVAARATIVGDTLTTAAAAVEVFDPMLDNNIATTTLVVSPNTAPAAGIQPVGGPVMSPVPLDFSLHDAESDPCRLEAAYSLDGGGVWTTATVAGPITGLGSSPFGVAHTVAWDAMADLGTTWGVVARIRITPSDEWQTGTAAETDAFTVDTVIPSADLAVTKTGVPDSVEVTGVATYTVGVTNRGPASAPDVVVADTLLTGMELVSASVTTGTVGIADQLVTATVTALEPGEATTMTLQVRMAKPGIFVNAASALSSRPDPVPANNTAFAQTTVTLGCTSRDELLTTAGWELFLKEPNEMDPQYADFSGIDYDPANSALRCRVSSDPGTAGTDAAPLNGAVGLFRAAGWKTRDPYAAATLPYASIGTNGVARTKWFVYATGNEPAQVNTIPATRMMIHNRFIVSTTLEVFTHVNDGTASFNGNVLGQDIAPSTDPERPSLYRCDYDPVDAPFLIANSQTEGLSRGFIAQGDKPQDNGYICLAETVTACYPKVLTDGMLVQRLLPSASDAGALRIAGVKPVSDVGGSVHLRFSYPFNEASGRISMVDFDSGPTMTEGPFGVTLDSTEYDNQPVGNPPMGTRAGILLLGFYPGDDLAARPRVEPGKQYRVRFHVTGTQQSNLQAQLRLQVNTGANTYAQKYELGGPQSGGAQAQQLAKEVLPGIGNSNPSGEYDLLMYTPLSLGIRPDAPDIKSAFPNWMLFAGPGIDDSGATAYPAGLNRRDLRIQVVLIDTLSYGPKAILEKGNYTIDRIEVYAQDAVDDGSPM